MKLRTGLIVALSETQKTGFVALRPIWTHMNQNVWKGPLRVYPDMLHTSDHYVYHLILLNQHSLTLCLQRNFFYDILSSVDFYQHNFFKILFQEKHQSVKQLGSRSGRTFCRAWSGSKLFAKFICRWQNLQLVGKVLNMRSMLCDSCLVPACFINSAGDIL